ncbi:hypothetical protein L208DRAFT_160110 [Tricholoma matsutake]|nr:hypothetical protein L208DRAFT_160110 [Tricholoma matsutake 945]
MHLKLCNIQIGSSLRCSLLPQQRMVRTTYRLVLSCKYIPASEKNLRRRRTSTLGQLTFFLYLSSLHPHTEDMHLETSTT